MWKTACYQADSVITMAWLQSNPKKAIPPGSSLQCTTQSSILTGQRVQRLSHNHSRVTLNEELLVADVQGWKMWPNEAEI